MTTNPNELAGASQPSVRGVAPTEPREVFPVRMDKGYLRDFAPVAVPEGDDEIADPKGLSAPASVSDVSSVTGMEDLSPEVKAMSAPETIAEKDGTNPSPPVSG